MIEIQRSNSIINDLEQPIDLTELKRRIDYMSKVYKNPMVKIQKSTIGYNTYSKLILIEGHPYGEEE